MKTLHTLFAAVSLVAATSALAGPAVTVTFRNLGTVDAKIALINSNETTTYAIASPTPLATVPKNGGSTVFKVANPISPDVNYAALRYTTSSGKTCQFLTTFVNAYQSGGYYAPKWNKSATPSGGAVCTATITSINLSNYTWNVEFTMK